MMRHTSIDLDATLVDTVKRLFGHGALHTICTEALQIAVNRQTVTEMLTPEEREKIAALQHEQAQARILEAALRECWDTYIKSVGGRVLLTKGPTKRVIDSLTSLAGLWLQERQYPVPPAAKIAAIFKRFSNEEPPGWRQVAFERYLQESRKETSSNSNDQTTSS